MREVFVDTSGWVALKHKGDTFWQAATTLHRALLSTGALYVTSNFVLDESYTPPFAHCFKVSKSNELRG